MLDQHFPAGAGQPVVVIGNDGRGRAAGGRAPGHAGHHRGDAAGDPGGPRLPAGHADRRRRTARPPTTPSTGSAPPCTPCPGADALVGGNTAINLDVERAAAHDRKVIIPVILVVVFLILALLLRALVAPIMLIATVVLSFAAALGVSALFFNHVFNFGGADTSFPLFVFVFLVALGIDYNIFLMTRVREEAHRHGTRRGALTGLAATGGVITSAGCVLAGHLRRARHPAGHVPDRARLRGRVRRAAGHHRGPIGPGHRAQPGPGPLGLVAEQARPAAQPRRRAHQRTADRRLLRQTGITDGVQIPVIRGGGICTLPRRSRSVRCGWRTNEKESAAQPRLLSSRSTSPTGVHANGESELAHRAGDWMFFGYRAGDRTAAAPCRLVVYATARRPDTVAGLAEQGIHVLALDVTDEASM